MENFELIEVTDENRANLHRLTRTCAKELDEHRRKGCGGETPRCPERFFAANGANQTYLTADPVTGVPFREKTGFWSTGEISPENGSEIFQRYPGGELVITVSDHLTRGLAEEIAAAQWQRAECSDWVVEILFDYKTRSDAFNVVARADGEVIGRLQCLQSAYEPRLWYYGDLFVKPTFCRRHIGERMLQTALETLCDRGCRTLRCYVEPDNIPSLSFQRKHGFSEKPFLPFDELLNEGRLMFERELCAFEAVRAGEEDARYICQVYEKSAAELHGRQLDAQSRCDFFGEIREMLARRDPDEENFLLCLGAVPCGWFKVNGLQGGDTGWISMLAVEPKFRRRGAGRFAVNFAVDFLENVGKKIVKINTTEENFAARALYESCGFSASESHRGVSDDGIERIYLTLEKILN